MKVAVLKETADGEARVALVPEVVKKLTELGAEVAVESGAGLGAAIRDGEFETAGARIVSGAAEAADGSDAIVFVQPPRNGSGELDRSLFSPGRVLLGFLDPLGSPETARALSDAGVSAFAMELVPRSTRAQRMDALSSQASVAGYKAVLMAADHLPRFLPMLTTAAGTIRPAKALILGAGVAGLQAIATARRLGARVEAFDVRPAAREQVESLGATFLEAEDISAEGEGGYAGELSEEQHERELELIAEHIRDADLVITTAQIPGREAPRLITREMVESMKPGSVIVGLAANSGGNCELSAPGETVRHTEVTILGPSNLAALLPFHASSMYARNVSAFLTDMFDDEGTFGVDLENDVVGPSCLVHDGEVRNSRVRDLLGLPALEPEPSESEAGASEASAAGGAA